MKLSPEFIKKAIYSAESGLPVTWQAIHVAPSCFGVELWGEANRRWLVFTILSTSKDTNRLLSRSET